MPLNLNTHAVLRVASYHREDFEGKIQRNIDTPVYLLFSKFGCASQLGALASNISPLSSFHSICLFLYVDSALIFN